MTGMPDGDYSWWSRWRFALHTHYDRIVSPGNRRMSSWDILLTAWFIRSGRVGLRHAGRQIEAGAGAWVLIPPGVTRRHQFSDDARIHSIRCVILDPGGQPPGGLDPLVLPQGDAGLSAAADALAAALAGHGETGWSSHRLAPTGWVAVQAAVLGWCGCALERLGLSGDALPVDARVAEAQRLLSRHQSVSALPWAALRAGTGLSRPQLDRLFRRHAGGSVRAWHEGRLLASACRALDDRDEAVKAIAARLGFGDPSHFCRWFRRHAGASPEAWRRRSGA